jgi:hypothetical protein
LRTTTPVDAARAGLIVGVEPDDPEFLAADDAGDGAGGLRLGPAQALSLHGTPGAEGSGRGVSGFVAVGVEEAGMARAAGARKSNAAAHYFGDQGERADGALAASGVKAHLGISGTRHKHQTRPLRPLNAPVASRAGFLAVVRTGGARAVHHERIGSVAIPRHIVLLAASALGAVGPRRSRADAGQLIVPLLVHAKHIRCLPTYFTTLL